MRMSSSSQRSTSQDSPVYDNFAGWHNNPSPSLKRPFEIGKVEHDLYILRLPFSAAAAAVDASPANVSQNVSGLYHTATYNGFTYFLTIVDDCSRVTWTHLFSCKGNAFSIIKAFIAVVSTQFHISVQTIRTNNAFELGSAHSHVSYLTSLGISHQTSCPHTPQQNDIVKRKYKHPLDTARAFLFQSKLPTNIERVLSNKTPYEVLLDYPLTYSHLRSYGYLASATVPPPSRDKFQSRVIPSVFMGYASGVYEGPLGLIVSSSSSGLPLVCKLKKSLYDLKQVSRQWFAKLSHALISRGYSSNLNDYSLFTKFTGSSTVLIVVYVDNILLAGNDNSELTTLKAFSDQQFKIKNLGAVHYFLGLEVSHNPHDVLVNQHKYLKELLSEFHYCSSASTVVTHLDLSIKLTSTFGDVLVDPSSYRRLIGKLNFLQHTRPAISFSVQHLNQFLNDPRTAHMNAALHVLRYLVKDPDKGIFFNITQDFSLQAFSDSD
ncbi:uncharacterized protein [Nicotiana sylvestris]|uniref:uncharacterized protein n=1 Tax=Nicotiana sylvestris TaxID=4096 RepID=UPI00388C9193